MLNQTSSARSRSNFMLMFGLGLVSSCLGYITGASATPVVGVIIPAIFGLVTLSFAVLSKKHYKDQVQSIIETVQESNEPSAVENLVANLDSPATANFMFGLAMSVFAVFYTVGTIIGGIARTHNWYAPRESPVAKTFPWEADNVDQPSSLAKAVDWIELQETLARLGYSQEQISALYTLHREEVANAQESSFDNLFPGTIPKIEVDDFPVNIPRDNLAATPPFAQQGNVSSSIFNSNSSLNPNQPDCP